MLFFRTSKNAEGKQGEFSNRVGKRATLSRLRPLRCEPLEDRRMLSIGCGVYGPEVAIDSLPISPLYAAYADEITAAPTSVDLVAASDTGISDTDNLTNLDNSVPEKVLQFEVSGTVPGATVTVYSDNMAIGSTLATGTTTILTTNGCYDIADGIRSITARQTEPGEIESDSSAVLNVTIDTVVPRQADIISKLLAGDGKAFDRFGYSVSISGTTAIVGACGDDDNGTDSGSAYIFELTETGWTEIAKLTASDGTNDDNFGNSVSIDGTTAIVGAIGDGDYALSFGSAYIFELTDAGWEEVRKLTASDPMYRDNFGCSVSISGETAIVGVYGDDDRGYDSGSAYIYERTATGWVEVDKLIASDAMREDRFGYSVSIDGTTVIVGAHGDDNNDTDSGSAYIFKRTTTGWEEVEKLTASDGDAGDNFGHSVSIDGTTVIVGADRDSVNSVFSGSAYIFENTATGWEEVQKLTASDSAYYDFFGCSVSISGTTAIVGASGYYYYNSAPGSAYLYQLSTTGWEEVEILVDSDAEAGDSFGQSVAVSGTTAIAGAYKSDDNGTDSGSVFAFVGLPSIDLQAICDTGVSDSDNITSDATPTFDIAAVPYYRVYRDGVQVSGDYETASTYTSEVLPDRTYEYTVVAVDEAGNESGTSLTLTVTVDTTAPTTGAAPDLQAASDLGISDTDNLTCDNTPTFEVTDSPYFRLYRDGVQISGDNESGSYTAPPQPDGTFNYTIAAVDIAGNVSATQSDPLCMTIDTVAPSNQTVVIDLQQAGDTGLSDSDNITSDNTPTFDIVTTGYYRIYQDGVLICNYETESSYTTLLQSDGTYEYTIAAVDEAGNEWFPSPALDITIDTLSPKLGQLAQLLATDGTSGDRFGNSVSISGNTAIVGAHYSDDCGNNSGSVYIFEQTDSGWQQVTKLLPNDQGTGDCFGESVSISGNTAIVGAWHDDDNGSNSGSAYIFEQTDNGWQQVAKLTADDGAKDDYFGYSVSISGTTAIVGSFCDNDKGVWSGSAYIFEQTDTGWQQVDKLTASDGATNGWFGYSVSISDATVIVGAYEYESSSGSAYIFEQTDSGWQQVTKLIPADGEYDDRFGCSVSISGTAAIVGAYYDDDNGSSSGSAYVFEQTDTGWQQITKLTPTDGAAFDYFGESVSISGAMAIVGANSDDDNGTNSGSAYIFKQTDTGWQQVSKLTPVEAANVRGFGDSVSISDTTTIAGAIGGTDNGNEAGSAYMFSLLPPIDLQASSDTGADDTDNITSDNTPTFDIEAIPYYRLYRDGVQISGDYETASNYTSEVLSDGIYEYTVVAVDEAGNVSAASSTLSVTIDTTTPATTSTAPDLQAASDLGISDTDNLTCDNTPTFEVTDSPYFRLYRDGVQISGDNESGSYTAPPQPDGTFNYTIAAVDAAGNVSAARSDALVVTIDTTAPAPLAFALDLQPTSDSGISDTDNITNDTSPTFDITATGYYRLYRDSTMIGDYETASSYTVPEQPEGIYGFTIVSVDNAGNESSPSPVLNVTIDTTTSRPDINIISKLLARDGAEDDSFGGSVAISGTTAIVGAAYDNAKGFLSGSAYIFELTATGWKQVAKLTASDGAVEDHFGSSVAISGTTAIIGAECDDDNGSYSGSAYIFELTATGWQEVRKLTASDGEAGDGFGGSVAISGTTAIIGAYFDGDNNGKSGSAYVFEHTAAGWEQVEKLTASDGVREDYFGGSVSLNGTTAIIGAHGDDDNGSMSGSAYIFERTATGWKEVTKLFSSDGEADDRFGSNVSISGTTAIVGAWLGDDNGTNSGSAYIFERTITGWEEVAKLTASDGATNDYFGCSASISGTTVIVGAYGDDDNGTNSGSAYVFERTATGWEQVKKLTASDSATNDGFGGSVSVSGNTTIVGVSGDDDNGNYSGSAYIASFLPTMDLQAASDTGSSNTDNITYDTTPTFDITAVSYYRVYRDGVLISDNYETTTSYTAPVQASGTYVYTVRAVDEAGNEGDASVPLSVTIVNQENPVALLKPGINVAASNATFSVTYSDNVAISVATIGTGNILVTGPNDYSQIAELINIDNNTNGTPRTATYRVTSPDAAWTSNDNGRYEIAILADQVSDTTGNFVVAKSLGTFTIAIPVISVIPGDANLDGRVDGSDVTILAVNWQTGVSDGQAATWNMGDFNSDGKVDGSDVTILAGNWQAGVSMTVIATSDSELDEESEPIPTRQFTPPVNAPIGVATVPQRTLLPERRSITRTPTAADTVLAESTWSKDDYTAIAKDLMSVSVKKFTAANDELFALELDSYTDIL